MSFAILPLSMLEYEKLCNLRIRWDAAKIQTDLKEIKGRTIYLKFDRLHYALGEMYRTDFGSILVDNMSYWYVLEVITSLWYGSSVSLTRR